MKLYNSLIRKYIVLNNKVVMLNPLLKDKVVVPSINSIEYLENELLIDESF
jgi:hypothetical protein